MSITDERVQFYLRHREKIEEWAGLRGEVAAAADAWLEELAPRMEPLAKELGADVIGSFNQKTEPGWPKLCLRRNTWPATIEGYPCVALEWPRGKVTFVEGRLPYVGLKWRKGDPGGAEARQLPALRELRAKRKEVPSDYWVGFGYLAPPPSFPEATAEYAEMLVRALQGAWDAYAPFVDQFVAAR